MFNLNSLLPLSSEETSALLKKVLASDEEAFYSLIIHNLVLIYEIMKTINYPENKQKLGFKFGIIGIIRGISGFKLDQAEDLNDFNKYFSKYILKEINSSFKCTMEDLLVILSNDDMVKAIYDRFDIDKTEDLITACEKESIKWHKN